MHDSRAILEQLAQNGTPGPGAAVRIDVGSDPYLRFLEDELLGGLINEGGSACRFYEGEYGAGKTHLLQLIGDLALGQGAAVVQSDLSQALHLSDHRGILQHLLQEISVADSTDTVHRGLPSILRSIGWSEANRETLANLHVPHAGFRNAMRAAAFDDPEGYAWESLSRYLLGETISAADLRRRGIRDVKGPLSRRNAERVLQTLAKCLHELGIPALVLLFDETEHTIGRQLTQRELRAANLMRRFIDGVTNGRLSHVFVAFALLPGTIEQASVIYPALGQRLSRLVHAPGGYRRPVLGVSQINVSQAPLEFMEEAVLKISSLAAEMGNPADNLPELLRSAGQQVLEEHAGGYRRPLMKQLALTAVQHTEVRSV